MSQQKKIEPEGREALQSDKKAQATTDKETPSDANSENQLKVSSNSSEEEDSEVVEEPIFEMQIPMGSIWLQRRRFARPDIV